VEPTLLTPTDFDVVQISGVDEDSKCVYFIASPGDPLRRYLFRVGLDGSDLRRITPEGEKEGVGCNTTQRRRAWDGTVTAIGNSWMLLHSLSLAAVLTIGIDQIWPSTFHLVILIRK
jgi:hypothetical protein